MISYLSLISFGIGGAYIRYFARFKSKKDYSIIAKLNGMYLIIFSTLGVVTAICGIILVICAPRLFAETLSVNEVYRSQIIMLILIFNIALALPMSLFTTYITSHERYIFQKTIILCKTLINPFFCYDVTIFRIRINITSHSKCIHECCD